MLVRAAAEDKCVLIHPLLGKECRCPVSQLVAFNDELLRPTGELLYNQSDTTMAIAMLINMLSNLVKFGEVFTARNL